MGRISEFLTAEEIQDPYTIDTKLPDKNAIQVSGSFTWEATESEQPESLGGKQPYLDKTLPNSSSSESVDQEKASTIVTPDDEAPFQLNDLRLTIKRGAFVAIIGRVGSGKVP